MAKKNYENFPLSLAFFDALPVLFFGIAVLLIAIHFENILFITGAFLCTLGRHWKGRLGKSSSPEHEKISSG